MVEDVKRGWVFSHGEESGALVWVAEGGEDSGGVLARLKVVRRRGRRWKSAQAKGADSGWVLGLVCCQERATSVKRIWEDDDED